DVWGKSDNFRRVPTSGIDAAETRAEIDLHVSANGPAHLLELLDECGVSLLSIRIVTGAAREHSNPPHPLALLRARRERPRRRAAEQRDELAAFHSITSSARPDNGSGTVRPSALAVLRLITSSIFVTCCTGKSAGFWPLRMRPV